jgi:thioredoxin reductase (NADPH)
MSGRFGVGGGVLARRVDEFLTSVEIDDTTTGSRTQLTARALFVFIGAQPQSSWLTGLVELDNHGFVLTGSDLERGLGETTRQGQRSILATSQPGIFATGDVRRGATQACSRGDG